MKNKFEFIISVGSSRVSLTGVCFENENFGRCFCQDYAHGGLKDDFFADPERMFVAAQQLVDACAKTVGKELTNVYVILPQIFYKNKIATKSLAIKDGIVNRFDVNELMDASLEKIDGCTQAECVPIAFKVAQGYVDNPVDFLASTLTLLSSSIALTKRVQEFFDDLGKRLGISFVTMPISKPLLNKIQDSFNTQRSSRIVLYWNDDYTDVLYCEMRAMIAEKTVQGGRNDLIRKLSSEYEIESTQAAELLRHVNLNVSDGTYSVFGKEILQFDAKEVNAHIIDELTQMSEKIAEAIYDLTDDVIMPVYVTGSELVSMRGFENLLMGKINMPVQVLSEKNLSWDGPEEYVLIGLIDMITKE